MSPTITNKDLLENFAEQTDMKKDDQRKLGRKVGLSGDPHKKRNIKNARKVVETMFKVSEEQGYRTKKGSSQSINKRTLGIVKAAQKNIADQKTKANNTALTPKQGILQRLRALYNPKTANTGIGFANQQQNAQISMQTGKDVMISGSSLGKTADQSKPVGEIPQKSKGPGMAVGNQPSTPETPKSTKILTPNFNPSARSQETPAQPPQVSNIGDIGGTKAA
jgi:hypothetical protein